MAVFAAPAFADCPGGLPDGTCAYTSSQTIGSRTGGVLRFPQAVAVGLDGRVYVADQKSHAIQVFQPYGTYDRDFGMAGHGPGEFTSAGGVAVAADNSVLVTNGSDRIDRYDASGQVMRSWGGHGQAVGEFSFGFGGGNTAGAGGGIAVGSDGLVYVADTLNNRVQRFDLDGGHGAEIVPPGTLSVPQGIAVRKTRMYVADNRNHRIVVFDTGGHQLSTIGAGHGSAPGELTNPYDVAADPAGRVFVADDLNHRIVRFGTLPGYAYVARWGAYGTAAGRLAYPRGIAVDAVGHVYVANTGNDRIDEFDNGGSWLRSFGSSARARGQFDGPLGVGVDSSGIRAVVDSINGRVEFLGPDASVVSIWGSPNPGPTILPRPVAVAFDAVGNAYVLDQRRSRIVVLSRKSGLPGPTIGFRGRGPGKLVDPSALAISAGGTIWVADQGNQRLVRYTTGGTYLGMLEDMGDVTGVAVTPDGNRLYVSVASDNRIRAYDTTGALLEEFGGLGTKLGKLNGPAQIALDAAGNLWVADRGNSRVEEFGPDGEPVTAFGIRGVAPGQLLHPVGIAVDCRGVVTVSDTDNNRVTQFQLAAVPQGAACAQLGPVAVPPTPQFPTLPAPDGPILSVSVLRRTDLLKARNIPLRLRCDTACDLSVHATVRSRSQRRERPVKGKRRHAHKPVVVSPHTPARRLAAAASAIVRVPISAAAVRRLRTALHGRRGLFVQIEIVATGDAGEPTTRVIRIATATA